MGEVVVSLGAGLFERPAGKIGKFIIFACNGESCKVGGLIDNHSEGHGAGETLSHLGFGAVALVGPGDGRGVITP